MLQHVFRIHHLALTACLAFGGQLVVAQEGSPPPDYPPSDKVLEGYEKVAPTKAGTKPMYTLWTRQKDGQMFAELPRGFAQKKYFIATTVASGEDYAGLQAGDMYVYWRQYDKRLALMSPNIEIRATGDKEAEASVQRLFTDRVVMEMPIVTMGPGGGPIIDVDAMLLNPAAMFAPAQVNYGLTMRGIFSIHTAKAFENNVEIAFEAPAAGDGTLKILHFSISDIPDSTGYQPRVADSRVGYFTTTYSDLAKYDDRETRIRYINRWHIEKADPKLKVSPPKNPIVFYIEHTTPVRYRRWVRDGILSWNKAFENVGIANAIEVYYQDAASPAHMDKDPEDVQYNFIRWLNNDVGTAIGPSRVHPLTGQILDADIILTDGWIRHYQKQFAENLPKIAMEGYGPDTLAWLAEHPDWDPRIRLAPPSMRNVISAKIAREAALPYAGHPLASADSRLMGDDEFDGLGRASQMNGMCLAAEGLSFDLALMKMTMELLPAQETPPVEGEKKPEEKKEEKKEEAPKEQMLDGMPESFVGPLIAHLVAHEVGHTMGLRHNFKASSVYTLGQINSDEVKGKKPLAGSVMDYIGTNIRLDSGAIQGDYCMTGVGPYDMWAIEYGYTTGDLKPILARVAEPELVFATDEDTGGPDPLARRYDFTKNPLEYAEEQNRLAAHHRARLLTEFLKDGDSWDRVRYGYEMILALQTRSLSMMSNWVGGAHINRDKKGDPNGRKPIEVVPVDTQRKALNFVLNNAFKDEAFGLTPELVTAMGLDKWSDNMSSMMEESTWPIHDRIMGIQASALTSLMNPTILKRIYDNEVRTPVDQDSLTLPEMLNTISGAVWTELEAKAEGEYTARKPLISSLRRNLQREHLDRLITLTLPGSSQGAAGRTISTLASEQLRQIVKKIEAAQAASADKHDPYTTAHLAQAKDRIVKALDASYILNPGSGGGGGGSTRFIFNNDAPAQNPGQTP